MSARIAEAPVTPALEPVRRIAAYGICFDDAGRVLLVRASPGVRYAGRVVAARRRGRPRRAPARHRGPGDRRRDRAVGGRERAVDVLADMRALPSRGVTIHTDRLIYEVTVRGGALRDRVDQPTDLARWSSLGRRCQGCRCVRSRPTRSGLPRRPVDLRPDEPPELPVVLRRAGAGRPAPGPALRRVRRGHRPGRPACC